MNNESMKQTKERPLRFANPECYRLLLEQLATVHLHPFDIQASVRQEEAEMTIFLRYGEGLAKKRVCTFSHDAIRRSDPEVSAFFLEVAKDCKKTLIAEYYQWMKP
jgi:hypothetical protein